MGRIPQQQPTLPIATIPDNKCQPAPTEARLKCQHRDDEGAKRVLGDRLFKKCHVKDAANLMTLHQIAQSPISTASRRQFENKVPEKQKLFQEDNGIPVHLKGGVSDALLYRATMILTVGGTAYAVYQLVMASFPKKQD
ncbi:cytochrome c oxidase subunit 7A2, mitochondrial-like [Sorex fumeus]|uniref:cytochrome c oxidase subunit 7A2, mitochondrial-like n=1 Tax=Sorex fumeus TaxID=62283 RepID=UPI0024ADF295|nr:cytochrome c oxidase subunit 7A2, mitochondrial-like [Sorex fumeus]